MKIDIFFIVHRDQMDVCMGNFEAQNDHCYLDARCFLLDFCGYPFRKKHHRGERIVIEIEQVIDLLLGYDQRMPFR